MAVQVGIQGLRTTTNVASNARAEDWRAGILKLFPNGDAPLTALTALMKSKKATDPIFHWWEKDMVQRRFLLGANLDAPAVQTQQTITLDANQMSAKTLKAGDVLLVEQTGERMYVAVDPSSDTALTVIRGIDNVAPQAVTYAGAGVNPYILVIGSAYEEGSMAPTGIGWDPADKSNYTQIFRQTYELTRTTDQTTLRTGSDYKEGMKDCLEALSIDMERAFWFGKKYATTRNNKPLRFTAGIRDQILSANSANVYAVAGTGEVDADWIFAECEKWFQYGSNQKMAFLGNGALLAINNAIRKNVHFNMTSGATSYGMRVKKLETPLGDLILKTHPLFTNVPGGTTSGTAYPGQTNAMAILDVKDIEYRYLQDIKKETNIQENGQDSKKDGYIAECGLELHHAAKSHFYITNIRTGVADDAE